MMNKHLVLSSAIALLVISPVHLSPVVFPFIFDPDNLPSIPKDFCVLTPNFGHQGSVKFIEECENLDIYKTLPIPAPANQKYGTHPMVCCPKVSKKGICFPTDSWCPTYVKPSTPAPSIEVDDCEDCEDYEFVQDATIIITASPKVSDEDCSAYAAFWGNGTTCVNLKDCPALFQQPLNPAPNKNPNYAGFCGWDDEEKAVKVCCPGYAIQDKNIRIEVEPRFPGYPCNDKVEQCKQWKNNDGCRTDMHFVIDPEEPDNGRANSGTMFDFMTGTCMETCQLCGDKGCKDEHPDCLDWAKQGFCVVKPDFMTHTCRESCGVCGFLSADDNQKQVVGENTYSNFRDPKFDCGRFKLLTEINPKKEEGEVTTLKPMEEEDNSEEADYDIRSDEDYDIRVVNKRKKRQETAEDDEDVDVFFSNNSPDTAPNSGTKFCGATLISDRWIVTASHCYDDFGSSVGAARQVKVNTIRDNTPNKEVIEIKRVYKHPKYEYPNLYNDIALLELGRRVDYNWDKYGDSPQCIDTVGENVGKIATVQGYGTTENGTLGDLLETNVTVISNTQCKDTLHYNTTFPKLKESIISKIKHGLPKGLSNQMFCAQGTEKEPGVIRGACTGDSGGPLFVRKDDGRQMLVGIVSGGIGCGQGYPGWYTKVSHFVPWIECIIDNSKIYKNNKEKIEKQCSQLAEKTEEESPDDYIFEGDLRNADNEEKYEDEYEYEGGRG